jgi:hypothetical protein
VPQKVLNEFEKVAKFFDEIDSFGQFHPTFNMRICANILSPKEV